MKLKRILAMAGVIILAALYISTLVLALIGSEKTMQLLIVAVFCTIVIPVMIHLFLMMLNARQGRNVYDEPYDYRRKTDDDGAADRKAQQDSRSSQKPQDN